MDQSAVQSYVESAGSTISDNPQMDEATTKAAVLREFLQLLGWQIPQTTELEYAVEAFNKTYKVDYAFVPESRALAFIEAKGVDTNLTEQYRNQLKDYLKNEGAELGILTNGKEYEVYRVDGATPMQSASASLEELPDRVKMLEACEAPSIREQESAAILREIEELRAAQAELSNRKNEIASAITDVLTDEVSETISQQAESEAKELIDSLIAKIEPEIQKAGRITVSDPTAEEAETSVDEAVSSGYVVEFQTEHSTATRIHEDVQTDVMADAVEWLVVNHNLISQIQIPYVPGRSNAVINSEPVNPDGEDMRSSRELSGGYYLNTHDNSSGKQRTIRRLAGKCDFEVNFGGEW